MILWTILAAAVVPTVQVQVPPAPARTEVAVDEQRLAAARRLVDAMHIESQYDLTFQQMIPLVTVQVFDSVKNNVQVPLAVRDKMKDPAVGAQMQRTFALEAMKEFKARYPRIKEATAHEYAITFTAADLDLLTAFYGSPLGQKVLVKMPELQKELFPIGATMGREAGLAAMQTTIERLDLEPQRPSS